MISRNLPLLGIVFTLLASAGCQPEPTRKDAGELRKIEVGIIPIAEVAQLYVGIDRGFFSAHGIELDLVPMAGGAKILQVLGPNGVDIGFSNIVSLMLFRSRGHDFVAIGGATYETPQHVNHALLVRDGSNIREPAHLNGTTIAVNTLQNIEELMLIRYLESHGIDPDSVRRRAVPFPVMPTVLEQGEVDAIATVEPFITASTRNDGSRLLATQYLALTDREIVATYVTSREWIEKNPNLASDFLNAFHESTEYLNENPGETRRIISEFTGISSEILPRMGMPLMTDDFDLSLLQSLADEVYRRGWVDRQIDTDGLVHQPNGD